MDTRKIRKLIELVKETGVGELEVKSGEESVRISCQSRVSESAPVIATQFGAPTAPVAEPPVPPAVPADKVEAPAEQVQGHSVKSMMVGTVYLASTPGAAPLVAVGDHVKAGDPLCLIEAMKMFNKIEADVSGVISARLVENEQVVEYDQPLFIIEPDASNA